LPLNYSKYVQTWSMPRWSILGHASRYFLNVMPMCTYLPCRLLYYCYTTPLKHSKMHEICTLSPNLIKLDHGRLNTGCSWQENHTCLLKTGILIFGLVVMFLILQNRCCGSRKVLLSADFWSLTNKNNQRILSTAQFKCP
jgi:hypothetical protein